MGKCATLFGREVGRKGIVFGREVGVPGFRREANVFSREVGWSRIPPGRGSHPDWPGSGPGREATLFCRKVGRETTLFGQEVGDARIPPGSHPVWPSS
jgi:hypothetical protein